MAGKLNSSIYRCTVSHTRLEPKKNSFRYGIFTFYLDLDEIDTLAQNTLFFSRNKWNLFSFYDSDFLQFGKTDLKANILHYLEKEGIEGVRKIHLLTHIRVLGYVFNPVCFYYCKDENDSTIAVLVEVHNTFGEMKSFLLRKEDQNSEDTFVHKYTKYFYVSPFQDLETEFEFRVGKAEEEFRIDIDDFQNQKKVFLSNYKGKRKEFSTGNLLFHFFRYPLITIKIITLIHWQAFKLLLKGLPYFRKIQNLELQKGVYNGKNLHN